MLRRAPVAALTLTLLIGSTACTGEVWYRVSADGGSFRVARADVEADTCNVLVVRANPPGSVASPIEGIEVRLEDFPQAHVAYMTEGRSAAACSTEFAFEGEAVELDEPGKGSIKFSEVELVDGEVFACKAKLGASFAGVDFSKRTPIWSSECPEPSGGERRVYSDLRAGFVPPFLNVTAWDPETSTCARAQLTLDDFGEDSIVSTPESWFWAGVSIKWMPDDSRCRPELYGEPVDDAELAMAIVELWWTDRADHSGRVGFVSAEPYDHFGVPASQPCVVDVNLSFETKEEYHWAPRYGVFEGSGLTVEGACE